MVKRDRNLRRQFIQPAGNVFGSFQLLLLDPVLRPRDVYEKTITRLMTESDGGDYFTPTT